MRAKGIGRRLGRAVFVLVAAAVLGAGVAVAHATESSWEKPPTDSGETVVVEPSPTPAPTPSPTNYETTWD